MARSNNQRRRSMKQKGNLDSFVPAWTKSKTKRIANKQKLLHMKKRQQKTPYNKVMNKSGVLTKRVFKSGGFNSSGKFGAARGAKSIRKASVKAATKKSRAPGGRRL
jgi:hypothetical protein